MENYKNSKIGQETAQKYGDIIEMERPQTEESLRKHPRMTLSLIHILWCVCWIALSSAIWRMTGIGSIICKAK